MLDEIIINDIVKLVKVGIISTAYIKDLDYREAVENRLN